MIHYPYRLLAFSIVGLSLALGSFAQENAGPKVDFPAPSPASILKQKVGLTDIEIDYSRPGVKGREIFGGLIRFGDVWRTGANSSTKIIFSTPVKLNGSALAAGTYGMFTIPGKDEWTIIFNAVGEQWGAYQYDASKDVLRIKAKPMTLQQSVESFTIEIGDLRDESATLNLSWEKTLVPIKIEVDVAAKLLPQIEAAMAADGKKSAGFYYSAAQFYFDHGQDSNRALEWANKAVELNPKAHYMVFLKAKILAKLGKMDEAIAAAKQSSELAVQNKDLGFVKLNNDLIAGLK